MNEGIAIVERVYSAKGNSSAADALIADYLPFIKAETSKAIGRLVARDQEDELSIAMIGFHEAIESYSKLKGAFLRYASVVMRRKLIDYYRREKRHTGHVSLDEPSDQNITLIDTVQDRSDAFEDMSVRDATKQEIAELVKQLTEFDVSLTDIADNCPKQDRTLKSCGEALLYARTHPELIEELKRTKRLPLSKLCAGTGVERKTLERHRKYVLALLIIYSNGYEIIRGHLKQVLNPQKKGGVV